MAAGTSLDAPIVAVTVFRVQELDDEDTAEQARLSFLGHLSEAAATALARAVSFGRGDHDDLARMAGHLSADTSGALGRRREISARRRAARRELEAAEQRLEAAERHADASVAVTEVSAILEASAATSAEVDVSYHVSGASWRPLYDLTLDGERLAVSYLAEVRQQSGEDWPAVELVLSTTRRGLHQALPELDPWYIGRARPVPSPPDRAMVMRKGLSAARAPGGPADDLALAAGLQAAHPEAPHLTAEPVEPAESGESGSSPGTCPWNLDRRPPSVTASPSSIPPRSPSSASDPLAPTKIPGWLTQSDATPRSYRERYRSARGIPHRNKRPG